MDEIERSRARLFDAPAHFYNQAREECGDVADVYAARDEAQAFYHETKAVFHRWVFAPPSARSPLRASPRRIARVSEIRLDVCYQEQTMIYFAASNASSPP